MSTGKRLVGFVAVVAWVAMVAMPVSAHVAEIYGRVKVEGGGNSFTVKDIGNDKFFVVGKADLGHGNIRELKNDLGFGQDVTGTTESEIKQVLACHSRTLLPMNCTDWNVSKTE